MGSFWLWGWWFFLTLPDRLSCPLFIYMVHFEFESTTIEPDVQESSHLNFKEVGNNEINGSLYKELRKI
jgi:hypothetical protein